MRTPRLCPWSTFGTACDRSRSAVARLGRVELWQTLATFDRPRAIKFRAPERARFNLQWGNPAYRSRRIINR